MHEDGPDETRTALPFVLPFVLVYAVLFIYPTCQLIAASFTDASLTLPGQWIGLDNYARLLGDKRFFTSVINTGFFVLLTVLPSTLLGLVAAMMVEPVEGVPAGGGSGPVLPPLRPAGCRRRQHLVGPV